jgi:hypothetical protein
MPGVLVVFWAVMGLGGVSALWGPPHAWSGVDAIAKSNLGEPLQEDFYLRMSTSWVTEAKRDTLGHEACEVVMFAGVIGGRVMRAQLQGEEQNLDNSWNKTVVLAPAKKSYELVAVFLEPIGGAVRATRTQTVTCVQDIVER